MQAGTYRFPLADPSDVSALSEAISRGAINPHTIVAVIGKTHGNGLVNDYTRGYLAQSLTLLISRTTGVSPAEISKRIPFIFSGGVEGVLSPHYTVFTATEDGTPGQSKALAIGVSFTPDLDPADIGSQRQIDVTAEAVQRAMTAAMIDDVQDVHFVQVKGPAFPQAAILADLEKGRSVATDNPGKLMAFGRAASALGVGRALGEIPDHKAVAANVLRDFGVYSSVASISAGVEVSCNEIVVVGLSAKWGGGLTISHAPMGDALDLLAVYPMLRELGFSEGHQLSATEGERIKACFVKCEAARSGAIRGKAHTMLNDGDMDQQRHIRGAVGAVVASVLGDTALFVSGGAEHQGPDGGGFISLIVDRSGEI